MEHVSRTSFMPLGTVWL